MLDFLKFLPFLMPLTLSFAEEGSAAAGVEDGSEGEEGGEETGEGIEGGETGTANEEGAGGNEGFEFPLDKEITLPNGQKVTGQELLYGYMRQDDYTRKTQELAEARRQLELAQEKPEEVKKEDVKEQISDVKSALSELAPEDPQAKALLAVLGKLEKLEAKVEAAEKKDETAAAEEAYKQQVEYMRKLTDDTMSEELKNYQLPAFKNPKTGKDINFADKWKEVVLTTLSGIDQDMTVPEFKALVREIGRKAYERLQDEISAISASFASAKKKPETPPSIPKEEKPAGGNLSLADKISAAFEKVEREKGG